MSSTSHGSQPAKKPNKAYTEAERISNMHLVLNNFNGRDYYFADENSQTHIHASLASNASLKLFGLSLTTSVLEPGKQIRGMVFAMKSAYFYAIKDSFVYPTKVALHLGLNPAHLVTKTNAVGEYLQDFQADEAMVHVYEDLGMAPEDAAKAIRMQHQMADSGVVGEDYLASLDGNVFESDAENQEFIR